MKCLLIVVLLTVLAVPAAAQAVTVGACEGYSTVISTGIQARVSPGAANRIRQTPGLDGTRIGEMPSGSVFSVLYGPTCADDLTWWLIRYQSTLGWTAEGEGDTHWLQPATAQNHAPKQPPDSLGGTSSSVLYSTYLCPLGGDQLFANSAQTTSIAFVLGEDSLRIEPGVCAPVGYEAGSAAISPEGVEMQPDVLYLDGLDGVTTVRITLPDIAYTLPGAWTLRVSDYSLYVNIEAPSAPFMWGEYLEDGSYRVMLGGFAPNERIVIVTSRTTADAVGYTPDPGEVEQTFDPTTGIMDITLDPSVFAAIQDMAVLDTSSIITRPEFVIQPEISAALDGALTPLEPIAVDEISRLVFDQVADTDVSALAELGMTADTGSTGGIFGLTFQDFAGTEVTADANGFAYVNVALDGSPLGAIGQSGALAIWPNLATLYVPGGDAGALRSTLYDAYWTIEESAPATCTYIVASGDTLNRIARSYGISLDDLLAANPHVTDPDVIFRGLELTIPNCAP